jgi:DNA-binding NarL/FixJ family response regulator
MPFEQARETLSLLIADADPAFRSRASSALEAEGFDVVGESGDAAATVAEAVRLRPDICLLDADLPGNGLGAVAAISRRSPGTTVVVLAASPESAGLVAAFACGASGYLVRGLPGDELAKTLRAAQFGEPAVARAMVPALIEHLRTRPQRRLALPDGPVKLTVREWDVAELLRDGLKTGEIADRLGLSPVTVRRHVGSMMRKLGTADRPAAVRLLERNRLHGNAPSLVTGPAGVWLEVAAEDPAEAAVGAVADRAS